MPSIERICVFCGSKHGGRVTYTATARKVGDTLAGRGIGLVYGGGDIGLMGEVADAALAAGGQVIGVIPDFMVGHEVAHEGLSELRVVSSMHERKAVMAELADGFIALPGGLGTFEELFEVVTWAQLQLHAKPVGVLNVGGFFNPLVELLAHASTEGFISPAHRDLLIVDDDIGHLLARLDEARPATGTKWDDTSRT